VAVVAVERPPTPSVDWLWDARLIELVVVVAIVGLLAAVVAVNVMGQGCSRSPYRTIRRDMQAIGDALDLYKVDYGHYPDRLDALWEQPAGQRRWGPEPYLKEYPPKDPWGNEYQYVPPVGDRTFELLSYGADGAPGGVEETGDLSSRRFFDAALDGR